MGKYNDMLFGDSYDPKAPEPIKVPVNNADNNKYYEMISGGAELRQGKPDFMATPTANVSPINDPSKMAGAGTQAIASLPTDMKERATYFAKQRFPRDPNAVARYGIQDGRLFYQADDGKAYFEEPSTGISRKQGDILPSVSPGEMAKYAASSAGPVLPVAGSIGGAIAGEAMNPFGGGIPAAGVGGAAGDVTRQALAMALAGQNDFSPAQTAKEGTIAAGGQLFGVGTGKLLNRNAARDISKIQTPEAQAMINELTGKSRQVGIDLTPAELTNLKSLKGQQNFLGDSPRSADTMSDFYARRNQEQVPSAIKNVLQRISPVQSAEVGAQNLQRGAEEAISVARAERKAAAAPLYKEVFPKKIPPNTFINIANTNNIIRNAINSAKNDEVTMYYINKYKQETGQDIATNSVGFLDAVKQALDDKAAAALRNGETKRAAAYTESAAQLRNKIDYTVPKYGEARDAYAGLSPAVTALTEGEVGLVAKGGQTNLASIPRVMFETGPEAIKANREAFVKAGQEQDWNHGLRAYLAENFNKARKETVTGNANPGAKFRNLVFGTPDQKKAMQNAMSPEQWAGFNRLMDVLEASGRVTQGGSRTYFAGEQSKEIAGQAMGITGKVVRNALDLPGAPKRAGNAFSDFWTGNYTENLANIITSPDAMKQLKQLKALNPKSQRAIAITSQILTQYGSTQKPADAPSGSFSNPQK